MVLSESFLNNKLTSYLCTRTSTITKLGTKLVRGKSACFLDILVLKAPSLKDDKRMNAQMKAKPRKLGFRAIALIFFMRTPPQKETCGKTHREVKGSWNSPVISPTIYLVNKTQ